MIMDLGLCDSFDEEDIEELQAQLEDLNGPSLKYFELLQEEQPIVSFTCIDVIKSILDGEGKDIKIVGNDEQSPYKAFFYVLLLIGVEERRNYPHLNTLIRQQFYKPNIFRPQDDSDEENNDQSRAMLEKCLQYFQEVGEGLRAEEYILREPLFERACLIMLKNSIECSETCIFDQLSKKFNIDMTVIKSEQQGECYQLGVNKNYHIIRENDYFFLGISEVKEDLNQSKLELESIRSGESGLHIIAPEASDQSTPKFKNSEVKFRKKSHKNSFGGDLQIVQYRDLLHLQSQKISNHNHNAKVLSEYFDVNEVESCAENLEDKALKKHSFQDIIDSQKIEMKGSTTLGSNQPSHLERRKDRKISSSQIIEYRDFNSLMKKEENSKKLNEPLEEEQEDDPMHKNAYNSLVVIKDEPNPPLITRMRTSLIQQKELERIEQRQSSQRESTHPDHQSELSEEKIEMPDNQSQVKLKDRKYSYFTQQMASTKSKKSKEIESSNYVFRIPKNLHKNSEVILLNGEENEIIRKRFQENPLRFSQLGAPSEYSAQQSYQHSRKPQTSKNVKLSSEVYSYQIKFEPNNWYKKEIIYHLDNGQKEIQIFQRTFANPIPVIPYRDDKPITRDSFESNHTLPSNIKMNDSNHFSANRQPSQTTHSINPYEINETSFLKNRIQSLANLQPFEPDHEDTKSMVFSTCRSLKNFTSPPKISFNYLTAKKAEVVDSSPSPVNHLFPVPAPTSMQRIQMPQSPQTLQFRQPSFKQSLSPQSSRPQTFNGPLSGPGPATEIRFVRR